MRLRLGVFPAALLIAGSLVRPSAVAAAGIPTFGCRDVETPVSEIGAARAARAFACWVDGVRHKEFDHPARFRLDAHLTKAAQRSLASGRFGVKDVARRVRRAGYPPRRHDGRRGRLKVARAAPVLISEDVSPLQIGDDVLWHDARVFAPPYRDIGVAISGNVFFAITAVRGT